MSKVVIDMTMSLDGFVARPHDGIDHPLRSGESGSSGRQVGDKKSALART